MPTHYCISAFASYGGGYDSYTDSYGSDASSDASSDDLYAPPVCRGVNRFGNDCQQPAKHGYDYCCAHHDPAVRRTFAPHMFAQSGLRYDMEGELMDEQGGEDFYRKNSLLPLDTEHWQLDHILELQCFAFAFNAVCASRRRCGASIQPLMQLEALVREAIANSESNVCLTRTSTNQLKGAAVWRFLDDSVTGHRHGRSLYSYLASEQLRETGVALRRSEMRSICRNMGAALRRCQRALYQYTGVPHAARNEVHDALDDLFDDMALGDVM